MTRVECVEFSAFERIPQHHVLIIRPARQNSETHRLRQSKTHGQLAIVRSAVVPLDAIDAARVTLNHSIITQIHSEIKHAARSVLFPIQFA